jgi:uncharacterized membrane protein (UPF0127 family)
MSSALGVHARNLDQLYEKAQFKLGAAKFTAYIADDEQKRAQGLMYIEKLPENTGMLFVFEQEQPLNFWMKNTLIPLSIGFFSGKGKLVDQQEMRPGSVMSLDVPTYKSRKDGLFALEMNADWFEEHKVKMGAQLELISKPKSALLRSKLKH